MKMQRKIACLLLMISGSLMFLDNGISLLGVSLKQPWIGGFLIGLGVLGLCGVNVFRGGPLDRRLDKTVEAKMPVNGPAIKPSPHQKKYIPLTNDEAETLGYIALQKIHSFCKERGIATHSMVFFMDLEPIIKGNINGKPIWIINALDTFFVNNELINLIGNISPEPDELIKFRMLGTDHFNHALLTVEKGSGSREEIGNVIKIDSQFASGLPIYAWDEYEIGKTALTAKWPTYLAQ